MPCGAASTRHEGARMCLTLNAKAADDVYPRPHMLKGLMMTVASEVISDQPIFEDPFRHQFAPPMPTLHVAQDYHRSLPGVPRHSSRLPAQPQTMWSVLPKFRNEILLLYGCTNVRQINSLQIRTLYLLLEFMSTIGSVNGFNLSHVLLCFMDSA